MKQASGPPLMLYTVKTVTAQDIQALRRRVSAERMARAGQDGRTGVIPRVATAR